MAIETEASVTDVLCDNIYNFIEIEADQLNQFPNGIQNICENEIHGLIILNAFNKTELDAVCSQLTRVGPFPDSQFGDILIYGPALYVSESNLTRYRKESIEFRQFCKHLFSGGRDFEARVESLFKTMSGGRPVSLPLAPDNEPYTPTTIRVLEQGQDMGWHFENQFLHCTAGYQHLSTLIEHDDHLSYFVTLEAPDKGGDLILYDMQWSETEWLDKTVGGIRRWGTVNGKAISSVMESRQQMSIKAPAGSLVVFDGGRILHRVSAVESTQRRVSIGGFLAFSKNRKDVYYWS